MHLGMHTQTHNTNPVRRTLPDEIQLIHIQFKIDDSLTPLTMLTWMKVEVLLMTPLTMAKGSLKTMMMTKMMMLNTCGV